MKTSSRRTVSDLENLSKFDPMNAEQLKTKPLQILKSVFGYNEFRDTQAEIIDRTISGKDSMVIMPTGGGKSMCYQIPALAMDGFTLVVSPLIALMQDQVMALKAAGVNAAAMNSQLSQDQKRALGVQLEKGEIQLLYVSPEVAVKEGFINYVKTLNVNLIAVDEAHCVSVWGNDFRPEYAQLHLLIKAVPNIPHIALTATADKATQKDISKQLQLTEPKTYLSSFERKNISSIVVPGQNRMKEILRFLEAHPNDAGIIYTLSRKAAEDVAQKLFNLGHEAAHYHGAMSTEDRNKVQNDFKNDDVKIVCATIAFGMGIDKSNIRWVIHYNLPKNLESYYQEIGRSGRDGAPAETMLFFSYRDVQVLKGFIEDSQADQRFKEVQRAKLERMLEYCQATNCRTNVVLSYFGEHRDEPCNRCDNCLNPPKKFDGTLMTQKVLSGVKRLKEKVAITTLINVLRGSQNQEVYQNNFQEIKTYGALKEVAYFDLFQYITQLVNQGILEIDYTDHHRLKVTQLGDKVLFKGKTVELSLPIDRKAKPASKTERFKSENKTEAFEKTLFEELRKKRKELAAERKVPAYVVFSDKALQAMATAKPLNLSAFEEIPGVGQAKLEQYGSIFIELIRNHVITAEGPKNLKGKTYMQTLDLLNKGKTPEEIAEQRKLNLTTVYSHLAMLYSKGEDLDLNKYVNKNIQNIVIEKWKELDHPKELKTMFSALDEKIPYHQIRLSIAITERENGL